MKQQHTFIADRNKALKLSISFASMHESINIQISIIE